ncbi:MAG: hypothetical protein PHT27_07010, partial [Candidatus Izemoplasmatales bacterium]|nr:hypothetical protein [Candidatus Izemoplasmatales bacterium]
MPKISGKLAPVYIFLFVQGFYSMIFQSVLFRDMLARFAGTEFILVVLFGSFLFWTALGCMGGSFIAGKLKLRFESFASLMLTASVLAGALSYLASLIFMSCCRNPDSLDVMVLFSFLAPLVFGVVNGIIYGALSSFLHDGEVPGTYSVGAAGAMLGGVLFSIFFANDTGSFNLLCYSAIPVLCAAFLASLLCALKKMYFRSVLSTLAVSVVASLYIYFPGVNSVIPEWNDRASWTVDRSFETPDGRVDIVTSAQTISNRKMICFNSMPVSDYPPQVNLLVPNVVFSMMQVNKPVQKVLLCCSPFSGLPKAFLSIPAVSELTLVCQDKDTVKAAVAARVLPPKREGVRVFIADPVLFIAKTLPEEYDLIYMVPPLPWSFSGNRFYTKEFYSSVSRALKADGVFAYAPAKMGMLTDQAADALFPAGTLASVFSKIAVSSGYNKIVVAGNGKNITRSLVVLDSRISRNLRTFYRFPDGLLSIVFSQKEMNSELWKFDSRRITESNSIQKPLLPFEYLKSGFFPESFRKNGGIFSNILHLVSTGWLIVVALLIGTYSFARFILSRRMGLRLMFCSFENGFYSIGIVAVLLFVYQCCCGSLYRDLPALFGVFVGGTALGAMSVHRISELLRNFLMFLSIMVPVASYAFFGMLPSSSSVLIFGTLFICGIS